MTLGLPFDKTDLSSNIGRGLKPLRISASLVQVHQSFPKKWGTVKVFSTGPWCPLLPPRNPISPPRITLPRVVLDIWDASLIILEASHWFPLFTYQSHRSTLQLARTPLTQQPGQAEPPGVLFWSRLNQIVFDTRQYCHQI